MKVKRENENKGREGICKLECRKAQEYVASVRRY